jgi:hypothetical protein
MVQSRSLFSCVCGVAAAAVNPASHSKTSVYESLGDSQAWLSFDFMQSTGRLDAAWVRTVNEPAREDDLLPAPAESRECSAPRQERSTRASIKRKGKSAVSSSRSAFAESAMGVTTSDSPDTAQRAI